MLGEMDVHATNGLGTPHWAISWNIAQSWDHIWANAQAWDLFTINLQQSSFTNKFESKVVTQLSFSVEFVVSLPV